MNKCDGTRKPGLGKDHLALYIMYIEQLKSCSPRGGQLHCSPIFAFNPGELVRSSTEVFVKLLQVWGSSYVVEKTRLCGAAEAEIDFI
jgi:hypothetical protein